MFHLTVSVCGEPVVVLQYIKTHLLLDVAAAVTKAVFLGLLDF